MNVDRVIERFLPEKVKQDIGKVFEKEFISTLLKGYVNCVLDKDRKSIPGLRINTNEVKFIAYDDREVEFDCIGVLKNCLLLVELKSLLTPYSFDDLESRRKHIEEAKDQLIRRREVVQHDWTKIKELVSIDLPDEPYDNEHIIMIACTDIYDFTPLYEDGVYITDDSTLLKYFTNPYVESFMGIPGDAETKISYLWKGKGPRINELKSYLIMPDTVKLYREVMQKEWMPIYNMDENDIPLYSEEYRLVEDPVKKYMGIV